MSGKRMKTIEASGKPHEIGRMHGMILRREIRDFVRYLHNEFAADDVSVEEARAFAAKYIPYIKNFSLDAYNEMAGIAEGAEVNFEDIVMIALSEEVESFSHACTTFAATGQATTYSHTLLAQTWDDSLNWFQNVDTFMFKKRYNDAPEVLAFIFPGMIAAAGLNTSCLGISWNTVPQLMIKRGVPTYVIINEVIKQKTAGEAISVVKTADRAGCFNFMVADDSIIYNVESTPEDVDVSYTSSFYGHANHYVGDKFSHRQDLEIERKRSSASASTVERHNRITNLLDENYSRVGREKAKEFLCDHFNYPDSICSHPNPDREKVDRCITRAAWVMLPCKREWWISSGPPCENKFYMYVLNRARKFNGILR